VKTVLAGCGIEESEILWVIDDKGSFLFGRPSDSAPPLAPAKRDCLMKWVEEKDVRTGPIGAGAAQ
jgi:hypothetical protein